MLLDQTQLLEIDVERIIVNPLQPRRNFDPEQLDELAQSIQQVGLLHPPVVRPSQLIAGFYELVAGERRFRAWQTLGHKTMPVLLIESEETEAHAATLIENIHRSDLNAMEIAHAFNRLLRRHKWTQEELAARMGKKRSSVANYLRLTQLPDQVQLHLQNGKLSFGHAKVLLSLPHAGLQIELAEAIVHHGWSVREAEKWAKHKSTKKPQTPPKDPHLTDLEGKLAYHFGTKVEIRGRGKRGEIVVRYENLDDLDRILEKFAYEEM